MAEDAPIAYSVPAEARARIMASLALAWDGQWFLKVYGKFGWEAAAEINVLVRAAFARLEMRAILRALGKPAASDLADAVAVWQAYFQMFGVERGAFAGEQVVEGDTIAVTVTKCAAWEGSQRARLERSDQACLTCDRVWAAWFDALLPDHDVSQQVIARMGYGAPQCQFRVRAVPRQP